MSTEGSEITDGEETGQDEEVTGIDTVTEKLLSEEPSSEGGDQPLPQEVRPVC